MSDEARDRQAFEQAIKEVWGWAHRDIAELGFEAGWQAACAHVARELSLVRAECEALKAERDTAVAKLELLNQFYASDETETVDERLAAATMRMIAAEAERDRLKQELDALKAERG